MLKTILVDDETHCLETLQWQLREYCPDVEVLAQCNSPLEAIDKIKELKPDLVLLDIEMPRMNAFEMLKHLEPIDFDIIFTTAYDKFAVNAFKVSALDYLLKPIDEEELQAAIHKLKQRNHRPDENQLRLLMERIEQPAGRVRKLALPTRDGLELVEVDQILYCESESNYCHIYLDGGKEFFITRTLKEIQEALEGSTFLRVHNSYLVNLNHVTRYVRGDGGYVVMGNGKSLSVARSKKEELLDAIGRL